MDNREEIRPVSTAETEKFWTEGYDARESAPGSEEAAPETLTTQNMTPGPGGEIARPVREAIGIDLPGVGLVPAAAVLPDCAGQQPDACESLPLTLAGVGTETRAAQMAEERDRLLVELVYAARALAQAQIEPEDNLEPAFCTECVQEQRDGAIAHERTCKTGRVEGVLDRLLRLEVDFNQKEEARTERKPAAGDGIRPLRTLRMVCPKCSGSSWVYEGIDSFSGRIGWFESDAWRLVAETTVPMEHAPKANEVEVVLDGRVQRYAHQCAGMGGAA